MLQRRTAEGTSLKNVGSLAASADEAVVNAEEEATKMALMEAASSGGVQGCDKHVHDFVTAGPHKKIPDFEAMTRDIDEAINMEPDFLNSKVHIQVPSQARIGKDQCAGINADFSEDVGMQS